MLLRHAMDRCECDGKCPGSGRQHGMGRLEQPEELQKGGATPQCSYCCGGRGIKLWYPGQRHSRHTLCGT